MIWLCWNSNQRSLRLFWSILPKIYGKLTISKYSGISGFIDLGRWINGGRSGQNLLHKFMFCCNKQQKNVSGHFLRKTTKMCIYFFPNGKRCMMGDWNGVVVSQFGRISDKEIKLNQSKLPKSYFDMMDNLSLAETWRERYGTSRR